MRMPGELALGTLELPGWGLLPAFSPFAKPKPLSQCTPIFYLLFCSFNYLWESLWV